MGLDHIIQQRLQSIKELILDICCTENAKTAGMAAVLIWNLWQNRNNCVWNDNKLSARQIGMKVGQMWNDWAIVQGLTEEQNYTAGVWGGDGVVYTRSPREFYMHRNQPHSRKIKYYGGRSYGTQRSN
ncbi:hypothetical protein L195_g011175 [Trifolium pratense]|uniref:Uncharacterized protein n=1 Tax=Trifolium pratense TaxID=57577 RepID=A0A2K3PGW5_TRIPR|nr:hypothetical protein L195_g011175 [Trifolium pratense]